MSKFWQNTQSSDSESEESSVSEEEVKVVKPTGGKFGMFGPQSDSESEDDGARVVKSQKDRMWDNVKESVRKIRNSMKTGDWPIVQDEFEELNKKIEKAKILINQHGIPKCYIKVLSDVADNLAEALKDKEGMKKLKPAVVKALNQMKLKVRKHNEKFKDQIADFKENPQNYESEAEEEDADEDEDESEDESDDSDDSDEDDDDDDDESSEDSDSDDDDDSDD
jgi:translation initiation factor 3 subunit C